MEEIKKVPIDSVTPWKDNPRKNDKAVPRLMKLLETHGQITPIVVWTKTGDIYKGNTTWKALKKLGAKKVLVLFYNFQSKAEATAYAISDNKASEWSEWDDDVLRKLMSDSKMSSLAGSNEDIEMLTGFNEKEYLSLTSGGMFASKQFVDIAEEFSEKVKEARGGKKSAYWFWFEVETEKDFNRIKKHYERGEGKRLHRELDAEKVTEALLGE